ncbi:hypothetical protein ACJRO7_014673 [Eucalyptus globulus]|uniref:Uncharacterized protein n=1 Tax=Eucalyptus globulus TaxID=34317 RepID=A0ABD3L0Z0_EUCGL
MDGLWRRISEWTKRRNSLRDDFIRGRTKPGNSLRDKNATQIKSPESDPARSETQINWPEPDPARSELVLLGNPAKRFDFEDVMRASKQEVGKGTFGMTYRVDLEDGTATVILKMLDIVELSAEDFRDKVEAIGAMDHENLLPLRGYFYSKDQKFLLYDYMPQESLFGRLHTYRRWGGHPLSWEVRLLIALGAARAIEYLHFHDILSGNIKSSNILLTSSYEARVSDYSLDLLAMPTQVSVFGHSPPTQPILRGDTKSKVEDVYDFGQLLLEFLTGEPHPQLLLKEQGRGTDLPQSVEVALRDKIIANIFNGELMTCHEFEEGMVKLLEVAISCVPLHPHLAKMLSMSEVRRKIEELNDTYARKQPDGVLEVSERVYGSPQMSPSLSESSVDSALEGSFVSLELATESPCTSPKFELDQQYDTTVEENGQSFSLSNLTGSFSSSSQQNGSSSSTFMSSGYDYDVFLSFRGLDTRLGITNVLYTRLSGAGIHTFKDDEELHVGKKFETELVKAICQSKIAIPIFSKDYASSKWCLNELVQMVECSKIGRQKVMPLFYGVTPKEVRHQSGSYEKAFISHKLKFGANAPKWEAALNYIGYLTGWDDSKKDRGEGELVEEIVQEVINQLKMACLPITDCLVGVESHVKKIDTMMCADSKDIRILGIHGMGGVGKTTLAKIIYNRLSHHFEACCFLSDIRGTSELKGIEVLQNQLISDVLKRKGSNISNVEEGIKILQNSLRDRKVLVLLDDVDQMAHWDALIGNPALLGLGSRIIITSRNKDIVDVQEVCYPYELMSMNFNQSLQLFCKHAFGRDCPTDDYVAISIEVVRSTGGLPLALEAIGKLLPCRSKHLWDAILKKLKQVPLKEVKQKLKISYDALDDREKHIFLDIACIFTGFDQRIALCSWKNSNLFPEVDLEVLQKMSLIKISEDKKIWMHDQLRGLGRDIAHKIFDKEREKQTQSRNHEEGLDGVMETKGTKKIEALCQKFDPQLLYYFANEEVERSSNQRYTEVRVFQKNWPSNDFPANLQNKMLMLSKLRWLSWHHFPIEVKITNFSMMNIVILHLGHFPSLVDIQSIEGLASLRILKLIEIPLLERLPELSKLKKLNELQLGHCHNLIDLQSIEGLGNLRTLKLIEIPLLKRLPDLSNLKKLTELHLRYCHGLTEIKSFDGLENLMILKLGELPLLERLPNLSNLRKLTHLDLRQCHNLVKIQGRLESLEDLSIKGCRSLDEMFDPASSFKKLKSLQIHDCEKLHLDRIWVSKFERSNRVYGNSRCLILSKMGICVCQLGRQFFLPSLP